MWRSAVARRRRHAALSEMVDTARHSGRFDAPWEATPQVWEFFRDEDELLRHLQREWRTALAGAVYVAIEAGDGDLQEDIPKAFQKTFARHQGLRRILEANSDHPAIAAAMRKERALLSSFVGLASGGSQVA
jgi:hypothetical protein